MSSRKEVYLYNKNMKDFVSSRLVQLMFLGSLIYQNGGDKNEKSKNKCYCKNS